MPIYTYDWKLSFSSLNSLSKFDECETEKEKTLKFNKQDENPWNSHIGIEVRVGWISVKSTCTCTINSTKKTLSLVKFKKKLSLMKKKVF